jgi:ankyrin repeat protein
VLPRGLANGQPEAARHLADRGAPLDLPGAAGIGRVDVVESFFDAQGRLQHATADQLVDAFGWACGYGRLDVVDFLLERGVDPNVPLDILGCADSPLRVASAWGHDAVVERLRRAGAKP